MENRKIRVGITHGDINGVGYEVILKTFSDPGGVRFSQGCCVSPQGHGDTDQFQHCKFC